MPRLDADGQELYYEDSGGTGPAVLFSHGFLMDHEMFAPQVAALAEEFRCITWDERGHGATPVTGPFDYWDSAGDALAILDALDIAQAALVGMSQGGFLSLRAALRAPTRVSCLVLIDSQAGVETPAAIPLYDAMHDEWVANGPGAVQDAAAAIILGPGVDPAPWLAKWGAFPREHLRLPYRCLMDRDDLTDRLGEITAPALVFHGDEDGAIPMARAEALCEGLAACEGVVVVRGAGHASNLGQPEQVNPALRAFLLEHAGAGGGLS